MSHRPFLLITNDDGIHAPGLRHLWEAVHEFADLAIVAPQTEKSGSGLSITWTKPLLIKKILWDKGTPAWSVTGTPADCVKMALSTLLETPPDLIISGVNRGSNSGRTVLYSGTVGGIIEGVLKGIPGIAFSFSDFDVPSLSATKQYFFPLISHILKNPLPTGSFLNVNFPLNCDKEIKGIKLSKQGKGYWSEAPEQRLHPEGTPYYWLGGKWSAFEEEIDSDVSYLEQGYIAAAPIHVLNLTDQTAYQSHKEGIDSLFPLNNHLGANKQ
jgi:5'-nucleotidase